ncbi:BSD domain-containing protein [Rhizoctonia solani AG-1 IA]|uniref:BSD domain-containing protein n=1 Tax=Thanatephorus cucumeris (strain AG1-IA) TaxID=983506 RepID=L8WWX6_THACA|nr:BSD domain-containing protein [Rhizoctonia solani AG-1 IA]
MSVVRARAKASFQKKPGYLVLTQRSLSWTEDKQKEPRLNLPNTSLQKMFFSKPGSASTSMKVMDGPDPKINAYTFVFTSLKAVAEGNNFKELITNILTANIAQQQAAAREQAPATDTQAAAPVTITPRADRPLSVNDLRKFVLLKRADLAALHRELVMTGNLTETEFWAGREHLLSAEESIERQRKGRPTQMLELRGAGTNEKGDIKITITPERAQQIFIEFPVVKRAYDENVPDPWNSGPGIFLPNCSIEIKHLRAQQPPNIPSKTTRSSTSIYKRKMMVSGSYLVRGSPSHGFTGDEPLHQRAPPSTLLIDLNATHEDHGEVSHVHIAEGEALNHLCRQGTRKTSR